MRRLVPVHVSLVPGCGNACSGLVLSLTGLGTTSGIFDQQNQRGDFMPNELDSPSGMTLLLNISSGHASWTTSLGTQVERCLSPDHAVGRHPRTYFTQDGDLNYQEASLPRNRTVYGSLCCYIALARSCLWGRNAPLRLLSSGAWASQEA
jgi:hypothetical protein